MINQEKQKPFPAVLDALFFDDPVPISLLFRLSDMSPQEQTLLETRWLEATDERRRVLVRHLADLSEENFVVDFSPVFSFCLGDRYAPVRIAALDGVWDSTNTRLIGPIIALMQQDEDAEVQATAARALAHYILMAEWGELPRKIAAPIVAALLEMYDRPQTAVSVRRAALEALGAADHPRIAAMIRDAYETNQPDMQLSAVFAMGSSADKQWLPVILGEMDSSLAEMRAEAARAAGNIGSGEATPELAQLTMDEDRDVQLAAVIALGQIGSDAAYSVLAELLEDPEFEDLHEAIEEAMEEMSWLGELDLLSLPEEDEDDESDSLVGDWLN